MAEWRPTEEGSVYRQERILRERFAQLICATCGARHQPDDMLVLAQRSSRWLLMVTCSQCQRRGVFTATFPRVSRPSQPPSGADASPAATAPLALPPDLLGAAPYPDPSPDDTPGVVSPFIASAPSDLLHPPHRLSPAPISSDDVDGIKRFLRDFDGDFRTLFGQGGSARD